MKKKKQEKIIYCWNCGKKNPKKRWFCIDKECNARLKQKDHPLFYWLFGEIKGDIEDNFINYICQLIINFFRLHLYGVTMGLALAFTGVATINHYDEAKQIEVTNQEYYISVNEEGETVMVTDDATAVEEKEEIKEEKPQENKKEEPKKEPTKSEETKKEETKPEVKKTCPSGYQMRSDGMCESIAYTDAIGFIECENGFDKVDSNGNQTSSNTGVYCMSHSPTAQGTKYCPSTKDDFIAKYGNDECISASSSFTGTLNGNTCNYTFFSSNGNASSCSNTYTYKYKCPTGNYFQVDMWCYDKKDTITNYYCFDKTSKKYVLSTDRKCRTVIEATAN